MPGHDDGSEQFAVICGASNVRPGSRLRLRVSAQCCRACASKRPKLRGVESQGMICSASELELAETSEGILELPSDAPVVHFHRRLYLSLADRIIEVDLTPNRGDCLSIAGVAREVCGD